MLLLHIFFVFMFSYAHAQPPENGEAVEGQEEIKPLIVGEKVPDTFWTTEHTVLENGQIRTVNLQHIKGKPLLLDFWATWCASCIKRFPQLDTLRTKYRNELQILLVNSEKTRDTHETIKSHWNTNVKELRLPTILGDQYITQLFPRYAIPYYIWIDRNGRVSAMTSTVFINEKVIESFLAK